MERGCFTALFATEKKQNQKHGTGCYMDFHITPEIAYWETGYFVANIKTRVLSLFLRQSKKSVPFATMQKTIYCEEYGLLLQWLRERRMAQNLTMRQLAERLDVHHSWIGRVEVGERRLDVMEFVRYCAALEADPCKGIALLAAP